MLYDHKIRNIRTILKSTLRIENRSTALPTPPEGGLCNSFIFSMSRRSRETGINEPVEALIRLSILKHRNLTGKKQAEGAKRATPVII